MYEINAKQADTIHYALRVFLDSIQNPDTREMLADDVLIAEELIAFFDAMKATA